MGQLSTQTKWEEGVWAIAHWNQVGKSETSFLPGLSIAQGELRSATYTPQPAKTARNAAMKPIGWSSIK